MVGRLKAAPTTRSTARSPCSQPLQPALRQPAPTGGPSVAPITDRVARLSCLLLLIAVVAPRDAYAQIYAWRDVNGTLVLSDRKLNDGAMTYTVPEAPGIRATTPTGDAAVREEFEPLIREHAARHALRVELVRADIHVESGYNPRARSPNRAMALVQLMPLPARQRG